MASQQQQQQPSKKEVNVMVRPRTNSDDSTASLKSPRAARFAEATSVDSPVDPPSRKALPFASNMKNNGSSSNLAQTSYYAPQAQVADMGFGYIGGGAHESGAPQGVEMPATPRSPLKSALKSPGAPPRKFENPLSPTFREEDSLEKAEKKTEAEQKKDLKTKIRVRMAKVMLRCTNFACSLIVLSMLSATFTIFNATKHIPPRNSLPPWAKGTNPWPQITLLVISCISLFFSLIVFYGYWRGGHRRAEKVAVYYTTFAVGFFMFSIIMWGIGAGILQGSRNNGNGQDVWGWACKDNARKHLFEQEVQYDLVCRLQNWSLVCCIIEVVVEVITILIYAVTFYRYFSKRRLRKSMANRDAARSDLYLAQLRSQSQPNTPGPMSPNGPYSPRDGGYNPMFSPRFANMSEKQAEAQVVQIPAGNGEGVRYIDATQKSPQKPFVLKAPPKGSTTPKSQDEETFTPVYPAMPASPGPQTPVFQSQAAHQPAAPGEQQYESVPIPGAYASPINSPTNANAPAQGYFAPMR